MKGRSNEEAAAVFAARVNRTPGDGCWEWTGYRVRKGYGSLMVRGRAVRAHRFAWEMANGPIPPGLMVCHRCDNPACVRLSHLFLGTASDNVRDMIAKDRQPRQIRLRAYCARGHAMSGDNVMFTTKNGRVCRVCRACKAIRRAKGAAHRRRAA